MSEIKTLDLLKGKLVKGGKHFDIGGEKFIGLYFSANWCPPCHSFTPKLRAFYERVLQQGHVFEVVFVSADSDHEAFDEYFKQMPWAALDFEHGEVKDTLAERYGVRGFPTLVVLDSSGALVTTNGRSVVNKKHGDEQDLLNWN